MICISRLSRFIQTQTQLVHLYLYKVREGLRRERREVKEKKRRVASDIPKRGEKGETECNYS